VRVCERERERASAKDRERAREREGVRASECKETRAFARERERESYSFACACLSNPKQYLRTVGGVEVCADGNAADNWDTPPAGGWGFHDNGAHINPILPA